MRAAFRDRHDDLGEWKLNTIDFALKKVMKRNPDLLIAFYRHYAVNELTDQAPKFSGHGSYNADRNAGDTEFGGTLINPSVLDLSSKFPTDDPTSLLAGTLIHECAHVPGWWRHCGSRCAERGQGVCDRAVFAERMGDHKRANVLNNMSWNSSLDVGTGSDKIFQESYTTMRSLYRIIDQGGPAAKEAREMSVEFTTSNSADFEPRLLAFVAKNSR